MPWPYGSPKLIGAGAPVYPRDAWIWTIQFWRAIAERAVAIGGASTDEEATRVFPIHTTFYYHGIVGGASETTIADGDQYAEDPGPPVIPGHQWPHEWYGYIPPPDSPSADDFDVIIDTREEHQTVRAHITSAETGTVDEDRPYGTTLNIDNLRDFVTQGVISDVAELVGRDYWIVRHNEGTRNAPWWSERRPRNEDTIFWEGSVTGSSVVDGNQVVAVQQIKYSSYGSSDSAPATMDENAFPDKQIMVRGDDGFIKRVAILSNTADTFTVEATDWVASGRVVVVDEDTRVILDNYPQQHDAWYGGATIPYWSHEPTTGTLQSFTGAPDSAIVWSEGDGDTCTDISHDGLNSDLWSSVENLCSEAGKSYSPLYYKSLRGLQVWIEENCTSFVDPTQDWDGAESPPRTMTIAEFFYVAGINAGFSEVGSGGGAHRHAAIVGYAGVSLYWMILNDDFSVMREGESVVTGGQIDLGTGFTDDDTGKPVIYSAGWTRHVARRFHYAYDKTVFLPGEDEGGLVTTPTTEVPGDWSTRAKSTNYTEPDEHGFTRYTSTSDAFVNNELAMYGGDCFNDPTTDNTGTLDPLTEFIDHFYTGKGFPQATLDALAAKLTGTVTSGTSFSLTETGKDFYTGSLITQTGSATGGTDTTIDFLVADDNGFFDTATGRYAGFMLKMTSGLSVGLKRPITNMSVGSPSGGSVTVTLTVDPAFVDALGAGDTFSIDEPGVNPASQRILNQFKGRTLIITKENGTTAETIITHNDNDTLFFDDVGFVVDETMTWRIVELEVGKTYRWKTVGSKWETPTGVDPRTGRTYSSNQYAIEPTYIRRYRKINKRDVDWIGVYQELYDAINRLVWTLNTPGWTSQDEVNENHPFIDPGLGAEGFSDETEAHEMYVRNRDFCDDEYANGQPGPPLISPKENDGTPPYAFTSATLEATGSPFDIGRAYAYARSTGIAATFKHATDFYVYPTVDPLNHDAGAPGTSTGTFYIFDNNGDDAGTYRTYHKWSTLAEGYRNTDISGVLGDTGLTQPEWGPEPFWAAGPPQVVQTIYRGWYAYDRVAILRWDVDGGFEHIA